MMNGLYKTKKRNTGYCISMYVSYVYTTVNEVQGVYRDRSVCLSVRLLYRFVSGP